MPLWNKERQKNNENIKAVLQVIICEYFLSLNCLEYGTKHDTNGLPKNTTNTLPEYHQYDTKMTPINDTIEVGIYDSLIFQENWTGLIKCTHP